MGAAFGPRRALVVEPAPADEGPLAPAELAAFETLDLVYRSLCALLFNYVPTSGHPGGSISAGRFSAALLFDGLDYDLADPDRDDADVLSYAAGHKAMGLYALWALRDEIARLAAPELLPADRSRRLRLEDLLGFRRNPTTATPLFAALGARALDGHPTPATPFVRLATGASGVGLASSIGLAIAARDRYGADCPRIHVSEGEGGLTPGRASEALAAAGTASLAQRRAARRLEPGLDRQRPCLPRGPRARRLRAVGARRAPLPARLERRAGGRRSRPPAGRGGPAPRGGDRQRPAHRPDLPHAQGLALRPRGPRLARGRPQALLRGLLPLAPRAHRAAAGPADLRGGRPALRRAGRRRGP